MRTHRYIPRNRQILPPLHEWTPEPTPSSAPTVLLVGASVCLAAGLALLIKSEPEAPKFFTRWGFGLGFTICGLIQSAASAIMCARDK